jgi:hypothetical protein
MEKGSKVAPFTWKYEKRVITVQSNLMIIIRVATCMRISRLQEEIEHVN